MLLFTRSSQRLNRRHFAGKNLEEQPSMKNANRETTFVGPS